MAEERARDLALKEELRESIEGDCERDYGEEKGLDDAGYVISEWVRSGVRPNDGMEVRKTEDTADGSGDESETTPRLFDFETMGHCELRFVKMSKT